MLYPDEATVDKFLAELRVKILASEWYEVHDTQPNVPDGYTEDAKGNKYIFSKIGPVTVFMLCLIAKPNVNSMVKRGCPDFFPPG